MLVVNRFRAADALAGDRIRADLEEAHALLAACPGYLEGRLGRSLDDPDLWVLSTRWESVGAYRRALSSYDVKAGAVPVLSRAIDEPSAYELVGPDTVLNTALPRVT
ncbi:antibiotic biosynthesis monooxygenase [Nocardioides sp. GY 10113]|uniref:antibiotic biosynthesis monooxygenase family protein n=1 Tax=Nocardioides sp. GY 10113 TaxID=2569761 RepID=UPI0010A83044|nr:antibiotic biosynthesis monooxygenase family protein [Nocardioides sp. GY 10113]TIC84830.1 antibiotic biosynthesis monooxygenase [Nocardioides sp. GY 10113]